MQGAARNELPEDAASSTIDLNADGVTDRACLSQVELVADNTINAWADGERVMITTAILDQCRTDDELAFVIGHEMSHNILHHRARLVADGVEMGLLPVSPAGSAKMRETEEEADRLAARITSAAGYDLAQAAPLIRRLLAPVERHGPAAETHPPSVRRLAMLKVAVAQLTGRPARH
ncbi:M48 family metalloprotease [Sphingomonas radiodurans]|uniref:M48 family metalloprotease n=1 Tax=Sphingomonas radiodurans TaxID=2890321 RepID=UPI001E2EA0D1|nr:M48 family metalloprotease [Sphingomonas radiodurans]WBH18047.1 M48 family metalloprotease [Sphingomonas radiodurans]